MIRPTWSLLVLVILTKGRQREDHGEISYVNLKNTDIP